MLLVQLSAEGRAAEPEELGRALARLTAEINRTLEKHARIAALIISKDEWTTGNGLVTHTLKIKRAALEERYREMAEAALVEGGSTESPQVLREGSD